MRHDTWFFGASRGNYFDPASRAGSLMVLLTIGYAAWTLVRLLIHWCG